MGEGNEERRGREGGREGERKRNCVCPILSSPSEDETNKEDKEADHFGVEYVGGSSLGSLLSMKHLND